MAEESNGWDFGPGNQDDYTSGNEYTVPTESNYDDYYSNYNFEQPQQGQQQQPWSMDNMQSVAPFSFENGNSGQYLPESFGMSQGNFQQGQNFDLVGMFDKGLSGLSKGLNLANSMQGNSGNQNTNTMLKSLAGLWAASQEKKAQSQYGQQTQQAAQQMQQNTNPFSAERARYQQELASVQDRLNAFRQNPNANAQYKTLQDQLISQANRGSRQRGTSDVQMAAALAPQLTKSQMDFENQMINDRAGLYQPAGANLNGSSGILEALLAGNKATATAGSNASYADAIGRLLQGNSNSTAQDAVLQRLAAALQGQQ